MSNILALRHFPELGVLESLIKDFGTRARVRQVAKVSDKVKSYPLYSLAIGSEDPEAPTVGFFAGVHGLERIGAEVVLAYMQSVLQLVQWDHAFVERLKRVRLVFMPIVNPVGIVHRSRSNGNGIDLMRNSPLSSEDPGGPLYRGHRVSSLLPWYRGRDGAEMEIETKAILDVVRTEILGSKLALAIDVHSGFGARDRFWFPYAHSRRPFPHLAECFALKELYDRTYSHHFYAIEPMSRQYTVHGDPWDFVFEENYRRAGSGIFIPFCLEMGSWTWLRKNPLQLFSRDGVFHPRLPHRKSRILRRHLSLFDFLSRAVLAPDAWCKQEPTFRAENTRKAMELWYGN